MSGRTAIAVIVAVVALAPVAVPPLTHHAEIRLTSVDNGDSPLGDGTALIFGTSGTPVASDGYQQAVDDLYLQPRGFDGTIQAPWTPEGLYPVTGVHSLPVETSFAQEEQILDSAIQGQIAAGGVDAANPVVVFGWSQSADFSGLTEPLLASQGVPSDDVHFIMLGDASNPDGGLLERFDIPGGSDPSVPSLGITFDGATPADLYPTDIYTNEYDGFADFPKYPINFLSDLNAFAGILFDHITYLNPLPGQMADAIQLPTSMADTLTNYYMVPEDLPLLDLLRFIPVIGNPLADLLQPDMSVLVNLGYGSIDNGWSPGFADVPSPMGLFPDMNWGDVLTALVNGIPQGINAAITDLENPADYQVISSILDNPLTNQLISIAHTMGFTDATDLQSMLNLPALLGVAQNALSEFDHFPISHATLLSSPTDLINDLSGTLSADYAALLPVADTVNALLTSLPAYDLNLFTDQLEAGNLLGAIGDPIAADIALVPFAFGFGAAAPVLEATAGTLINLVDLIPGL
jgi:PE-PPE domain-containing protein